MGGKSIILIRQREFFLNTYGGNKRFRGVCGRAAFVLLALPFPCAARLPWLPFRQRGEGAEAGQGEAVPVIGFFCAWVRPCFHRFRHCPQCPAWKRVCGCEGFAFKGRRRGGDRIWLVCHGNTAPSFP